MFRAALCGSATAMLGVVLTPAHVAAQQYASPSYGNPYAQLATPQYDYGQVPYNDPPAQPQYGAAQPQYAPQQPYAAPDLSQPSAPAQALSAQDLEQMLAPIALYPDALLGQILAASTYPAQVAVADQWLQQMRAQGYGSPDQVAAGAQAQTSWDPSIKALTAFPDVLDMLNHNLEWTTALGNAYYNQPQDVMQTVQVLRDRAQQAGNLESTPQEQVTDNQGYIQLQPTDPEQVYVPTYDPWDAYGQPISPYPGFSLAGALGDFLSSGALQYGLSFALGAFGHFPFGWLAWGFDWLGQAVLFDHSCYYTHSATVADWGLPRGGPRAYYGYGRGGADRWRDGPHGSYGGYGRQQGYNGRDNYSRGNDGRGNWDRNNNFGRGNNDRGNWSGGGPGQSFERPAHGEPYMPPSLNSNRGAYSQGNYGSTHPEQRAQAYNRAPQSFARSAPAQSYGYRPETYPNRAPTYSNPGSNRPQTFGSPSYGYGSTRSPYGYSNYGYAGPQAYSTRPGFTYANPARSYQAPGNESRGFSGRSFSGYGNSAARSAPSGGFHLFGHNSQPKGYSGGYSSKSFGGFGGGHAPKSFGGFGGGGGHSSHSFGGGGGGGHAPKMSHSRGGGGGHHHF